MGKFSFGICAATLIAALVGCTARNDQQPGQSSKSAEPPSVQRTAAPEVAGEATLEHSTTSKPPAAAPSMARSMPAPKMSEAPGEAMAASSAPGEAYATSESASKLTRTPPVAVERLPQVQEDAPPKATLKMAPTIAPSTSVAPSATAAPPVAIEAKRTAAQGDFATVRVYYGTDRQFVDIPPMYGLAPRGWFTITVISAVATMLIALLAHWLVHSRLLLVGSGLGLAATIVLGFLTVWAQDPDRADATVVRRLYGNQRGALEMGLCEVSIPRNHQEGQLEAPSIFKLEIGSNPLRHVTVLSTKQQTSDEFFADMKATVSKSDRKDAFVFVHGYNVSFDNAARRTAQIAYDLKFGGAPVFFSWPSQGGLLGYTIDENNVTWAVPHLKTFLLNVARESGATSVHLIAHSMGNRALTAALREMHYELDDQCPKFRDVILTAPDIDADVFRRDLAPAMVQTAERVTLYASSNDEALVLSKKVHGYPRAGDSGDGLVAVQGIDTIDVSAVDTSLLGHSYYGNNRSVLGDLYELLNKGTPPDARTYLRPMQLGEVQYWVFRR